MLHRKIEQAITSWIQTGNKALLVYGVRQAGKTFAIRKCLKAAGADYVEFNLIEQPEIITILQNATNTNDFILRLSLFAEHPITPGKTIVFFDEIQRFKEIVTRVKFLVEDGRFRYVMSGSLLGVEITNLKSAPVGYLQTLHMYPLDFEEFVQIFNVGADVLDALQAAFDTRQPVDEFIHVRMLQLFNMYLIIGGMPAAVEAYRKTEDINAVIAEHNAIIEQYKLDFTQYEEQNRKLALTQIYELIPAELNACNKRFSVSSISKNLRYERVKDSFVWLWKAGVALPVFNVTEPMVPLMINQKSSLFKLFLSDVGLLTTVYGKAAKLRILNNEPDLNKGAIFENVVAQELHAHGYKLYYYNSHKFGELDFVVEHDGRALPIEVKSGKDYMRHSALNNVLQVGEYGIRGALVFANCNVRVEDDITYLPAYMMMFLREDDIDFGKTPLASLSF